MKKSFGIAVLCAVSIASAAHAFDKAKFEKHLRSSLDLDRRIQVEIGSLEPSEFAGFMQMSVKIRGGEYMVYVTADEKKYFWGNVFDLSTDPDKERAAILDTKNGLSVGSSKAPVTVVEFTDMQCQFCKSAHKTVSDELHKAYSKDQVRWVVKHFPLSGHAWAEPAAIAVECAGEQKGHAAWEMMHRFFENQETTTPANVEEKSKQFAADLKLSPSRFEKCLKNEAVQEKVRQSKKNGESAGVASTPTFFVNGRMKRGFREFEDVKVLIDEKLEEVKK